MVSGSLPSNNQQKKTTATTAAVGGSGTPVQSMRSSNAMFKPISQNIDIAWKWNSLKDKNNRKSVMCDFCLKTSTGGITRAKKHQLGIRGDVGACRKIPEDIKLELKATFEQKKAENEIYMEGVQDEGDEEEIVRHKSGKRPATSSTEFLLRKKNVNVKGPLDLHFFKRPEETIQLGKNKRQTSINDACQKDARARTIQYIARFFYTNGIPFNVARSNSFKLMIEAIGNYGPHL
ncbi:hypothetical protein CR513_15908, partial [Mucuna pruriens]